MTKSPTGLHQSSRRKEIAVRFFTYGVMTLATIVGVVVCVGWAMGYRFDLVSGQLSQVALLQFNSYPTGASVDINGVRLSARTPTRSNIKTGETKVSMSLKDYRTWTKTVSALPSSVRWLDYVRLVPQNIKTESVKTFARVDQMLSSPDNKWAVIVTDNVAGDIVLADIGDPKQVKFTDVQLDKSQISNGDDSKFTVAEWDPSSRYILIKHSYSNQFEYLEYDREDKDMRNLTRDFSMNVDSPHFSGTSGDVMFVLTDGDLRKIDYGSKSISAPIASNVQNYVMYDNSRIALLTRANIDGKTTQTVAIYNDGKIEQVKSYDDDKNTQIGFSRYNDVDYIAIGREETIAIYPNPLANDKGHNTNGNSDQTAYLSSPGGIDWLKFSPNGRFIIAGRQHKMVVYDVETSENYSFELEFIEGLPHWLDDYHLLDISDNMISLLDFDGQNRQHIVSGQLPAFLSNDNKYLFSLDSISGGVVLQRSAMTID